MVTFWTLGRYAPGSRDVAALVRLAVTTVVVVYILSLPGWLYLAGPLASCVGWIVLSRSARARTFLTASISYLVMISVAVLAPSVSPWIDYGVAAALAAIHVYLAREDLATKAQAWQPSSASLSLFLPPANSPARLREVVLARALVPLFLWWVVCSGLNALYEPRAVPANVKSQFLRRTNKKVGIALSGGGYRACLFHAGVLSELANERLEPGAYSTISGGSIAGAFIAIGGSPEGIRELALRRAFALRRRLLDVQNALRLPLKSFSRLDVQANLLDDVLFSKKDLGAVERMRHRPGLIIGTAEVSSGLQIGWTPSGYLIHGLAGDGRETRFGLYTAHFEQMDGEDEYALLRLSDLVSASGAFPGAFNERRVRVMKRQGRAPKPVEQGPRKEFLLVDGGLLDNSGLNQLHAAIWIAQRDPKSLPRFRNIKVVIESDGTQLVEQEWTSSSGSLVVRSLDAMYQQSQISTRRLNALDSATPQKVSSIRISPRVLYLPPPLLESRVQDEIYRKFAIYRHVGRSGIKTDLGDRLTAFHNHAERYRNGDVSFVTTVLHQKLLERKAREVLLGLQASEARRVIEIMTGSQTPITDGELAVENTRFARTSSQGMRSINSLEPAFLLLETPASRNACYAVLKPFEHEGLEAALIELLRVCDVFRGCSTLDDALTPGQVEAVFKLGQCLAAMQVSAVRRALEIPQR